MTITEPPPAVRPVRRARVHGRSSPAAPDHDRTITARPSLPSGRAVVGALLVTMAVAGSFAILSASHSPPTVSYVVTTRDVDAGTRLQRGDLTTVAIDLPGDQQKMAFASIDQVDGAVALAPLGAGQLVAPTAVGPRGAASDGGATFSFSIDRDKALDGQLQRGERIDLVATYGSGTDAYTEVVLQGASVIDVLSASRSAVGANGTLTLVVRVPSERDVLRATHAIEVAKVSVVRPGSDVGSDSPTEPFRPAAPTSSGSAAGKPAP